MFDAAPAPADHSLMQDPAFAAALRLCGEEPVTLRSGLVLLSRRIGGIPVLMLPRAVPPPDLIAQLRQSGLHRRPLILSPETPIIVPRALRIAAPQQIWQLDLRLPPPLLRARLHQKWRHQLVQAERGPLRVLERPLAPDHPLLALETAQARSRRYRNWPAPLTAAFAQAAPAQTHLFTALLRGHAVAHMLFLTHGSRATYHIGHATDAARAVQAHNLLFWQALMRFSRNGITCLDLGRSTPDAAGLDRFKSRTGARRVETAGSWLRWTPLAQRCVA